jgi:tetrahydromethanopterin S-methyltransferase subunit D
MFFFLAALFASLNLGFGIYNILQPKFTPVIVALNFSSALLCTLMTLSIISNT